MRTLRPIAVWMLLATVVAGGVLGPSLHRVQHGREAMREATKEPCHTAAVHTTDVPLWTPEVSRAAAVDCDLCATRILGVSSSQAPVAVPRRLVVSWVERAVHLRSATVVADPFIRGPPRRA